MQSKDVSLLVEIEMMSRRGSRISTTALAKPLGVSQQTISRWTRQLERKGMIERKIAGRGQAMRITENGISELRNFNEALTEILSPQKGRIRIKGRLVSGLREGKYYISLPGYAKPMKKILGFTPYPGTLNIAVPAEMLQGIHSIRHTSTLKVDGFEDGKRAYGEILLRKCRLGKIPGAIIFPARSTHPDNIAEIVAPYYVRGRLSLKDGDEMTIEVENE